MVSSQLTDISVEFWPADRFAGYTAPILDPRDYSSATVKWSLAGLHRVVVYEDRAQTKFHYELEGRVETSVTFTNSWDRPLMFKYSIRCDLATGSPSASSDVITVQPGMSGQLSLGMDLTGQRPYYSQTGSNMRCDGDAWVSMDGSKWYRWSLTPVSKTWSNLDGEASINIGQVVTSGSYVVAEQVSTRSKEEEKAKYSPDVAALPAGDSNYEEIAVPIKAQGAEKTVDAYDTGVVASPDSAPHSNTGTVMIVPKKQVSWIDSVLSFFKAIWDSLLRLMGVKT